MSVIFTTILGIFLVSAMILVLWDIRPFFPLIYSCALLLNTFLFATFGYPALTTTLTLLLIGHIALICVTLVMVGSSAVRAFKWNQRWFGRPLALEAFALVLWIPVGMAGGFAREEIFLWRLPSYTRAVETIKANLAVADFHEVDPPKDFWSGSPIFFIGAERTDDNRVTIEFCTWHLPLSGAAGYVYLSDDNRKGDLLRLPNARSLSRIRPCWFKFHTR